jgi:hypothetical protein
MAKIHKKNLIVNYKNLSEDVRELFKEAYPEGYKDYLQRTVKPNGEPIFTVPLETADTFYLIKFDVKVDSGMVEEDDDIYSGEVKTDDDSEFAPISEALDKEEGISSGVGPIRHGGDYEDFLSEVEEKSAKKKKKVAHHSDEPDENIDDFADELIEEEDFDKYVDEDNGDEDDADDEFDGPSDEDLMNMDKYAADLLDDMDGNNNGKETGKPAKAKKEAAGKVSKSKDSTKKAAASTKSVKSRAPKAATNVDAKPKTSSTKKTIFKKSK